MKDSKKKNSEIIDNKECFFPQEEMLMVNRKKKKLVIGMPRESDKWENRVCLSPQAVECLVNEGHHIYIEKGAGLAANYTDREYSEKGAIILDTKAEVFQSDIVLKVAPFDRSDVAMLRGNQTIFSSLQICSQTVGLIKELIRKKITAIAFDYYRDEDNCLSIVRSMSEIAGYSSILIASEYLSNARGGKGIMLGGITGISPTEVVVLGAGTAGEYAARTALSLGANVKIFDYSLKKLRRIQDHLGQMVFTSVIHDVVLEKALKSADVLIGAIRNKEGCRQLIVSEEMVKKMKEGSFILDLSIDCGGCIETSKMMTLNDSVYSKHKVLHFCVPNIASRVPRTAIIALSNIFIPMLSNIGFNGGITASLKKDIGLRSGVYMYNGILTNTNIAEKFCLLSKDINLLMSVL